MTPQRPSWIPSRRELPGFGLAVGLGGAALVLPPVVWPGSPWVSPVVVAIAIGALVLNSPAGGWIGLESGRGREADPYQPGLRFTGKWVLRLAIILMGLEARIDLIEPALLARVALILVFTLPTTFFVAHAVGGRLRLRREMADLVAIGTMICGASAINALAPTVFARRRDQGLAVTGIFLFSVVALAVLAPLGAMLGLDAESSGLWAGLAVNDLSSSVAVGEQFGPAEGVVATVGKTIRIVLLGPLLLAFARMRRHAPADDGARGRLSAHLPMFVLGYLLLFGVRAVGDQVVAADAAVWLGLLEVTETVVDIGIATVCAAIGLQIHLRTLVEVGWRGPVTAGAAWVTIAVMSVGLLATTAQGAVVATVAGGMTAAALGYLGFRRWRTTPGELRARLDDGEPLTLQEAAEVLQLLDRDGPIGAATARRVLARTQPAIGELVPLRVSPIQGGINYRRLTFWRSDGNGASLVGILWTPGTTAHIHSHGYSAVGRRIEGTVEIVDFARVDRDRLRVTRIAAVGPTEVTEFTEGETVHMVRNLGTYDAIDLHVCGPGGPHRGLRYTPRAPAGPLAVGREVVVDVVDDHLPVVMSTPRP